MSDELEIQPEFEIVETKTLAYEKYKHYFNFLEKLYRIKNTILRKLGKKGLKTEELSDHLIIAVAHTVWLGGQIKGILLLLNKALNLQASQLLRSLWEARVNLQYIAQKPEKRSKEFSKKANESFEILRKEATRQYTEEPPEKRFLPYELTKIPEILFSEKVDSVIWNDNLFERAKELGLTSEYRNIYKTLCQTSHMSFPGLTMYMDAYIQDPSFDPNEVPEKIPEKLLIASMVTLHILTEVNQVLKALDDEQINSLEQELDNLFARFNKESDEENANRINVLSKFINLLRETVERSNT